MVFFELPYYVLGSPAAAQSVLKVAQTLGPDLVQQEATRSRATLTWRSFG